LSQAKGGEPTHSLPITPAMRKAVTEEGQPLFSRKAVTKEADAAASDLEKHAGKRSLRDRARSLLKRMEDRLHPLSTLEARREYMIDRYLTMGQIAKYQEAARGIYDVFREANEADSKAIYDYMTDAQGEASKIKDLRQRRQAIEVKKMIEHVGRVLVENGVIPQESFNKYQGRYLPRLYLAYLLGDRAIAAVGTGKALSKQGYAKARNEDLPQEYRDIVLGEIKDPAFLASTAIGIPLRDVALIQWFTKISENQDWTLPKQMVKWQVPGLEKPRKVTPFWLKAEATRLRERALHYNDAENRRKAQEIAAEMDRLADEKLIEIGIRSAEDVPDGYKQMPNAARYGALRGLVVREEIYEDVVGMSHSVPKDASMAEKIFGQGGHGTKVTQIWKWSKVAANPPAQVRNLVSNFILVNLSGVPLRKMPSLLVRAIDEIRHNGKYYQVGRKYGITESTFAAQELLRIRREVLDLQLRAKKGFGLLDLKNMAARVVEVTGDLYQNAEMLGKLMKIIHEIEVNKLSEGDAAMEAQEWLFDYSLVGKNTRYLRNAPIGAPFLTFHLKVLPRLIDVAINHPTRYLPYAGLLYGLPYLFAALNGVSGDDWDKLKKALPDWLQERGHALILPMKDSLGRWQAVDLGYFLPWSMWTELIRNVYGSVKGLFTGKGFNEFGKLITGFGLFTGPIPSLGAVLLTGRDPFTDKVVFDPSDPASTQAVSGLTYLYTLAAPSFLAGVPPFHEHAAYKGSLGHLYEAVTDRRDKWGDPKSTIPQASLRMIGVNIYPLVPEKSRRMNMFIRQWRIREIEQRAESILRDPNLSREEKKRIQDKYRDKISALVEETREYARASQVPSTLK